jgi:hypothetical protein
VLSPCALAGAKNWIFSAIRWLNQALLIVSEFVCAVVGDNVGYAIGLESVAVDFERQISGYFTSCT